MIEFQYRPIDQWPADTPLDGMPSRFDAPYGRTLALLERELVYLDARNVVLQVALDESDIRLDGRPRARAVARHPGVIMAFDSKYGPLKYATGMFGTWQDNIRAIALGLEALRKVDRYGITKRGEQYTGWKAIEASTGGADAAQVIHEYVADQFDLEDIEGAFQHDAIRAALRRTHPDTGGSAEDFQRVMDARKMLAAQ